MAKSRNRKDRDLLDSNIVDIGSRGTTAPLKPMNPLQKRYINAIKNSTITLGTGYAGTGKSYIPAAIAAEMFKENSSKIDKIVICRPNEGVGKSIGFLKGGLNDKMAAWCRPILDVLEERLGRGHVEYFLEHGKIELLPLEYIRGRSYNNSFVILDEAQNVDWESLKCLLLRIGQDSKLVIDGDIRQTDIKDSGLKVLLDLQASHYMPMQHVDFPLDTVVRSETCKYLLEIFEKAGV